MFNSSPSRWRIYDLSIRFLKPWIWYRSIPWMKQPPGYGNNWKTKEFTVDEAGALLCNEYEVNKDTARNQRAVPTMVRNWVSHRIRQKDDLSPITKGFHAFAKARTVGPAGKTVPPFFSRWKEWNEIHSMARKQTVQGIIYDGIRLLPTGSRTSPEGIVWLDGGSWHLGTGEPATPGND